MGSGRLSFPAAAVSESQVSHRHRRHDASHAGAQIRILPQHLARQDKAARADSGVLLHRVLRPRLLRQPALVPDRGVISFLGTIFFLCLAEPLNKLQINWLMVEFWFTAAATFFYFTAFVAYEDEEYQYWIDAQIAAGVFGLLNFVVYAGGAYLIYMDWKANPPGGCSAPAPPTV